MRGASAQNRKPPGSISGFLASSRHSATDPIAAAHESLVYPRLSVT
jgi:hypothetical protein